MSSSRPVSGKSPSYRVAPKPKGGGFAVRGLVEHGDQRGRTIGFPTANVAVEPAAHLDGVWAGWVDCRSERHLAAISVGGRPTFYGADGFRLLEAHLVGFDGDIYGELITVWMCKRLREQIRFASVDALVAQLELDVRSTRLWSRSAVASASLGIPETVTFPFGRALAVGV